MMDPSSEPPRPRLALLFVVTLAAVVVSFVSVGAYSQYVQHAVDTEARSITENSGPSVQHLAAARAELRHLQILTDAYLDSGGTDAAAAARVERSRAEFHAEIRAYLELPTFPGERELWQQVSLSLDRWDQLVGELLAESRAGNLQRARERMALEAPADVDEASLAIARSIDFNAEQARNAARSIAGLRRRSSRIEFALDGISAALALGAAGLLYRWTREYMSLLRQYGELTRKRADEMEQFAGRVAHDVLSPLGTTSLALGMVAPIVASDPRGSAFVERGQHSLQRVERIVHGLLEFARAGAKPAPGSHALLDSVIEDVASAEQPAARDARIDLSVEPIAHCAVACSEGILTSLIENLVHNAVKYMGDSQERRIQIRAMDRGECVRVEIVDTGKGIPETLRPRVFEPYVREENSTQPGIGLGLATVKRIAEGHGGSVGVQSTPGRGSVFWFELPKAAAGAGQSSRSAAPV